MTTYAKMDPWIKAKWVAALRSGVYRQTSKKLREAGKLQQDAGHCCLGVLCDVVDPNRWQVGSRTVRFNGLNGSVDEGTKTKIGLSNAAEQSLIQQNDSGYVSPIPFGVTRKNRPARSFTQIADWIEKNL